MFGTICATSAALLAYSEQRINQRAFFFSVCTLGVLLTVSSAPLLALLIVITIYAYDTLLSAYPWRWLVLRTALISGIIAVFVISNNPVSWFVAHMTLEPQTGYYRIAQTYHATAIIADSPWVGYGFGAIGDPDEVLDQAGWDCVWLVVSVRHGIPAALLLFAVNIAAFARFSRKLRRGPPDPYLQNMQTAFTLVLMVYCFVGLTVHFWLSTWLFWGVCAGIRASLKEHDFYGLGWQSPARSRPPVTSGFRSPSPIHRS
jgi:O-antigen ligase